MSLNPYADQQDALADLDVAMQRLASALPRERSWQTECFAAIVALRAAVDAERRIREYNSTGEC